MLWTSKRKKLLRIKRAKKKTNKQQQKSSSDMKSTVVILSVSQFYSNIQQQTHNQNKCINFNILIQWKREKESILMN